MVIYNPPAGIDDFSRRPTLMEQMKQGWHEKITQFIADTKDPDLSRPSNLFFDQLADTSGIPNSLPQGITWNAFPLLLKRWFTNKPANEAEHLANSYAEVLIWNDVFKFRKKNEQGGFEPISIPYRRQDEYCEWQLIRENGKIVRIYFTVEPPEYWEFLAKQDFSLVLELYRELLHNPDIPESDLKWQHDVYALDQNNPTQARLVYKAGDYNPWNIWNTQKGLVHLTHWANTLGAEIQLASDATLGWPVKSESNDNIDPRELICCSGSGSINRASDPSIVSGVFDLAKQNLSVALANPVGLYIKPFELGDLLDPNGNFVGDVCLNFVRQSQDGTKILRAEISPPECATFTLDECTLGGEPLQFGGQIARLITMTLFGVAKTIPDKTATPIDSCPTFCCTYPTNSEFLGTFPNESNSTCARIEPRDWERPLRDVPIEEVSEQTVVLSSESTSKTMLAGRVI